MKRLLAFCFLLILLIPIASTTPSEIKITDFSAFVEENNLYMELGIETMGEQQLEINVKLTSNGNTIKTQTILWEAEGSEPMKRKIKDNILAGNYTLSISMNRISKSINFSVEPVHRIVKSKIIESTPLFDVITIYIENKGNVVEDYYVEEYIQQDKITSFITKPSICSEEKCGFYIKEIMPGTTAKIVYRIEYWPYTLIYILGAVAVLFVSFLAFFKVTNPRIKKRHIKKTNHIMIEIKNPFMREVKNVIVRDWISPLARVQRRFEGLKPVIRKSEAGTELIWRLGNLAAKEERVLCYKIKPLIEGTLKMPKAYMRFRDEKGRRIKIHSNQLVIKV